MNFRVVRYTGCRITSIVSCETREDAEAIAAAWRRGDADIYEESRELCYLAANGKTVCR